jgi:hypothetical protein
MELRLPNIACLFSNSSLLAVSNPFVSVLSMTTIYFSAIAPNKSVRKDIYACVHLAEIGTTNTRMILDVAYIQYIFTSSEL